MNQAHIHLILNHFPVVGPVILLPLLAYCIFRGGHELRMATWAVATFVGLLALPAFFTGEPAEEFIEDMVGVSKPAIEDHEEAAEASLVGSGALGVIALFGFVAGLRSGSVRQGNVVLATIACLVAAAMSGNAARKGGLIRHPEIGELESTATSEPSEGAGVESEGIEEAE
jgi:hypothetical protein